jgi:hypothetical protein
MAMIMFCSFYCKNYLAGPGHKEPPQVCFEMTTLGKVIAREPKKLSEGCESPCKPYGYFDPASRSHA